MSHESEMDAARDEIALLRKQITTEIRSHGRTVREIGQRLRFPAALGMNPDAFLESVERLRAELDALGSLDGIRAAALALPVEDRHRLRAELAATLPLPSCYVPAPKLLAHEAGRMTPAEVEELIGLLMKRRPS